MRKTDKLKCQLWTNGVEYMEANNLTDREKIHRALLRAVKEECTGMEIGLVCAELNGLASEIVATRNREPIDSVIGKMAEKLPRE